MDWIDHVNSPYIIRLLITVAVFILCFISYIFFLSHLLGDSKQRKEEFKKHFYSDLLFCASVLTIVGFLEYGGTVWIDHIHKTHDGERFFIHFFYEFFLILLTFSLLIVWHWFWKYRSEDEDYAELENDINTNMAFTSTSTFYALSLDDFNNFIDKTLGFWYFCEQAKHIKDARTRAANATPPVTISIDAKRIIVLGGTKDDNAELCKKAFGKVTRLTHSQINLKNLFLLHQLFEIELYLIDKEVFEAKLKELYPSHSIRSISGKRGKIEKNILEKFDRILINDILFHPAKTGKQFNLKKDPDSDKGDKIKKFFDGTLSNFTLSNYKVYIDDATGIIRYPQFN